MIKIKYTFLLLISLSYFLGCTIGLGRDFDGSAVLWKNRDRKPIIESDVIYVSPSDSTFGYVKVVSYGGNSTYMGFNDQGFGIANSLVYSDQDLYCLETNSRSIINDEFLLIEESLKTCSSIEEFTDIINSLGSTFSNIAICEDLNETNCSANSDCAWFDGNDENEDGGSENDESQDCSEGCFANHIQSNFAVIDNDGNGAIIEVDTFNGMSSTTYLSEEEQYLFRSNHFRVLNNPTDYSELNNGNYDCFNLNNMNHKSNARRWCSSNDYYGDLYSQSQSNSSIIRYLIDSDPSFNDGRGALMRSLSRSKLNSSDEIFYDLPYYIQSSYDCGEGRPAGYIYSNYSIARYKTVSSVVMKSIPGNLDSSFILTALGNPLFTPYVPIKISDFGQVNSQDFSYLHDYPTVLSYLFDWDEYWIDSQHLEPSADQPNHDGIFSAMSNLESQYIDFSTGLISNNLNSSLALINTFFANLNTGFVSGGYDDPIHKVEARYRSVEDCSADIFPSYKAERIIDETFHRDHSGSYKFKVEQSSDSASSFIVSVLDDNVNPIITEGDWSLIPSQSDVNVYLIDDNTNDILASLSDQPIPIGCTNDTFIEYDSSNRIDDGSCGNLGDINTDGALDVLDVVEIMNLVLEGEYYHIADINNDGFVNVLDILQIVTFILS